MTVLEATETMIGLERDCSQPFAEVADAWPSRGQLHMLQHPDWWGEAFERSDAMATTRET